MTSTIAYDKPVTNLIDELSATGHVTRTAYKKTSVTLHHNAGRLSHMGVLNVWKTRPASAHFDVDSAGAVAQYVKVNEYAWAAGNSEGNRSSIHIEMANSKLSPTWEVGEPTWKSAARLAGWLFFKVIGVRPNKSNLFYHHHWSSTACAGPYMDKIYDEVLKVAQLAYDWFKDDQEQKPSAPRPSTRTEKSVAEIAKDVIAGKYGNGPERTRKLLSANYDPNKVQAEVNRLLNRPVGVKSIRQVADEVYRGKWGNDPERSRKLRAAGYDPASVQRVVNRLVREGRS